jgi:hypothetical protein
MGGHIAEDIREGGYYPPQQHVFVICASIRAYTIFCGARAARAAADEIAAAAVAEAAGEAAAGPTRIIRTPKAEI